MNSTLSICIVDDDSVYQFTIRKAIEKLKLAKNVIVFSDGEEALDFMLDNLNDQAELPDIILLDINMPIMDGFQFLDEYVKIKPKVGKSITIYMVSSSVDPIDIRKAKSYSEVSDYIVKPIRSGELKALVESLEN